MEIAIVIVNLILLFYFTRMALHSRQVQVAGKLGPTWIITVFFIVIGIIRLFQEHSVFSIVQTVLIVLLGVLYSQMRSGFSGRGIVLLGNLYTWDRITQADVIDAEETQEIKVEFTVKKVSRFIYFSTAQREAVEAMLTRYEQERAELELKAKAKG